MGLGETAVEVLKYGVLGAWAVAAVYVLGVKANRTDLPSTERPAPKKNNRLAEVLKFPSQR